MDLSVSNSTVIIALNNSVMRLNLMNTDEIDSKTIQFAIVQKRVSEICNLLNQLYPIL